MKLANYDFIFPLEEACSTSGMMNKLHFRKMICPFDWMFGSYFTLISLFSQLILKINPVRIDNEN